MRPETASCLADACLACNRIAEITSDITKDSYTNNWRTQSIVERLFTIAGEALVRIRDLEEPVEFHPSSQLAIFQVCIQNVLS